MSRHALEALKNAIDRMARWKGWNEILAQNLNSASCEGFLQASLLGWFNIGEARSKDFWAERERRLLCANGWKVQPDLILVPYADWDEYGKAKGLRKSGLVDAGVWIKVAWEKGNDWSSASAVPAQKAKEIAKDVEKGRWFLGGRRNRRDALLAILISGGPGKKGVLAAWRTIRERGLGKRARVIGGLRWLLQGHNTRGWTKEDVWSALALATVLRSNAR